MGVRLAISESLRRADRNGFDFRKVYAAYMGYFQLHSIPWSV